MLSNKTYRFVVLFLAAACFASCEKKSGLPEIESHPDEIRLYPTNTNKSVPVEAPGEIIEAKKPVQRLPYYGPKDLWLSRLYLFIATNFDSVSKKETLRKHHLWGILEWQQEFENGIIYRDAHEPEHGSGGELYTTLKDKQQFLQLFGSVIEIPGNDDYIKHGWNHDSTRYEPVDEGAGCYYEIKSDTAGYYMTWYCGC